MTDYSPPVDRNGLQRLLASDNCILFISRDTDSGDRIVGMLTLVLHLTPTGTRAVIEDLVVDTAYRGSGIGMALTKHALVEAGILYTTDKVAIYHLATSGGYVAGNQ